MEVIKRDGRVAEYNSNKIHSAIEKGFLTERAITESLLSIKRAGADLIITNFAPYLLLNDVIE